MKSRNIFATITAVIILLSLFIQNYNVNDFAPDYDKNDKTDAYTNILKSLRECDKGIDYYTMDGITADGYPEYYAGAYASGRRTVILLADGYNGGSLMEIIRAETAKAELREFAGTDALIFKEGTRNVRQLLQTQKKIYEFMESKADKQYMIYTSGIDIMNGKVNVGIYPLDESVEEWFKSNIDDVDYITFSETPPGSIEPT